MNTDLNAKLSKKQFFINPFKCAQAFLIGVPCDIHRFHTQGALNGNTFCASGIDTEQKRSIRRTEQPTIPLIMYGQTVKSPFRA